ncbi:uncharacterized protein [Procambarus clarkii]|uniref:uncharacterized protein n=1 Tax=Procambarus clarkii TaxID=6728 RepID=UPI0037426A05
MEISVFMLVSGGVLCSCLVVLLLMVICYCLCKRRASHPAYTSTHTSCRTSAVYSYISSFRHPHQHRRNLTALSRVTNTSGPARAFLPLMSPVPSHPPPPPPLPPQRRKCSSYYHSVKNKPFSPGRAALGTIPSKIKYIRRERQPAPTPPSSREGSDCDHNKITCKSPLLETATWASQCSSDTTTSSPQIIYVGPLPSPPIEPPKEAINILSKMPYVSPGPPAVLLETSSFISEASTYRLPCVPPCSDPLSQTQPLHMGQMATLRPPDSECGAGHGFPGTRDWCHLRRRSRSRETEQGDDPVHSHPPPQLLPHGTHLPATSLCWAFTLSITLPSCFKH